MQVANRYRNNRKGNNKILSGAAARTGIFKERRKTVRDRDNNENLHKKECNFNEVKSQIDYSIIEASRAKDIQKVSHKIQDSCVEKKK